MRQRAADVQTPPPAAYLQYIVFDANRNPTGQKGFFRVTTASNMAKAKVTMPEITIEQPGFIYIFVYNRSDSPNWVFFDEMVVTHEHSTVVAGADYYPFGLTMDGREITDEPYRWGYQGQYAQENDSTGWNEFQLRMYDARFGRWLSPDPYGQYTSPYLAMGNMPHMGTDPDGGLFGVELAGQWILEYLPLIQSFASGATLLSMTAVVVETTIWNGVSDGLAKFGARMASGLKNTGRDLKEGFIRATDVVAGFNRAVAGDLAPEYHNRSEGSLERQEIGETIGTAFQAALSLQGIGRTGIPGTQLQPVRTTPGVTVTTQVSAPTVSVTDVHGQVFSKKADGKQFNDVCRELGIKDKNAFSEYLHKVKKAEGRGPSDHYTYEELIQIGKDYQANGGI